MKVHYYLVDAFAREVFQGAQIAVCPQADMLSHFQMQAIARELNQNECIFVQPSADSDRRFQQCNIQRGLGKLRQSLIEVEVEYEAGNIHQIKAGGYAVISAEGSIFL